MRRHSETTHCTALSNKHKEPMQMKKLLTLLFTVALALSLSAVTFAHGTGSAQTAETKKEEKAEKKAAKKKAKAEKKAAKKEEKAEKKSAKKQEKAEKKAAQPQ